MRFQGFNGGMQPPLEGIVQEQPSPCWRWWRKSKIRESKGCVERYEGGTVIVSSFGRKLIMELDRSGNIVKDDFPLEGRIVGGGELRGGYNSRRGGFFINRERVTRRGPERMRED